MSDYKLSKLWETQISLTEWLVKIGHGDARAMGEEDNVKRVRLGEVNKITGLPYDKPTTFAAIDVAKRTAEFEKFLKEHGEELCALRVMPKKGVHAEKLRNRGKSIEEAVGWFDSLDIDPANYSADFVPHAEDNQWATIFVVNNQGIFGEIYWGGHHVLTQGLHEKAKAPMMFGYDFKNWTIDPVSDDAQSYLKTLVEYLHVPDKDKQALLRESVGAEFANEYMKGYFETTHSQSQGTWFIDYNRLLGDRYSDYAWSKPSRASAQVLQGRVACGGEAAGTVRIVDDPLSADFKDGEILVCQMTTPDYIPLMMRAGGIVTDQGGILCHAAIVARELGKPFIVGTKQATKVLINGDKVVLDLVNGVVNL